MSGRIGPPRSQLQSTVVPLLMFGGLAVVIGAVIMVGSWPSTDSYVDSFGELHSSSEGSRNVTTIGGVVAAFGAVMVSVAVVAMGVRIAVADLVPPRRDA